MSDLTLSIDTSTARAFVAVAGSRPGVEGESIVELESEQGNSHHEELAALTQLALDRFGASARSLGRIVVGAGPGSFTGLRIGYTFARGLATSLGVSMFGVSSLLGAAWEFKVEGQPILAVADAGRGDVFYAVFRPKGDGLVTLAPSSLIAKTALDGALQEVVGDAQSISVALGVRPGDGYRPPQHVALGLIQAFRGENRSDTCPLDFEPEYLRAVAAKTIRERAASTGTGGLV